MTGVVTLICVVLALGTAAGAGLRVLRNQLTTRLDLAAAAVTELAVLVYVGVRVAGLIGGHHVPGAVVVVIAYLAAIALTLPVAVALSWAEPSRWSGAVLAGGALVVCVLFARIDQLWSAHG